MKKCEDVTDNILTFKHKLISYALEYTWLGLIMNYNLKFNIHTNHNYTKLDNVIWFLCDISGRFRGADRCICQIMYKHVLLPILML